jgi:group I intron endonuclease
MQIAVKIACLKVVIFLDNKSTQENDTMTKTNTTTGIYSLSLNGKVYIGASQNLKSREYHHFRELHLDSHHIPALQADFNQVAAISGNSAVSFEVLEYCSLEQLHEREDFHIETTKPIKPVYNSKRAGGGLRVITDASRAKSAARLKGKQMRYDGDFITPWGVFQSSIRAASASEVAISQFAVWKACKNPDITITRLAYAKSRYLSYHYDESVIGKTWRDIGFSFIAKAEDDTGIKTVELSPSERAAIIKKCGTELVENLAEVRQATTEIKAIINASKRHLN